MSIIAIIPARGGSKRFPRKNIAEINGKPMIYYAIKEALESKIFDKVVVSSEDNEILSIATKYGADVMKRPEELASDDVSVPIVCAHMIEHYEKQGLKFDVISILLPTSPLRTANDITKAFEKFKKTNANFLMSMTDYFHNPFRCLKEKEDGRIEPFFGEKYLKRDQLTPKVFVNDGSIFFAKTEAFKEEKTWYGKDLVGYYIPPHKAIDINDPSSLELVEFFMNKNKNNQEKE